MAPILHGFPLLTNVLSMIYKIASELAPSSFRLDEGLDAAGHSRVLVNAHPESSGFGYIQSVEKWHGCAR